MLRLSSSIDSRMAEWFAHLETLPWSERQAILEAVKSAIRRDAIGEIADSLLTLHPLLGALWAEWRDAVEAEAWAATLKTIFLRSECVVEEVK